jgi:hypothetical protein
VEVHQASTNSSDLSFDLELIGVRPILPPAVSIQRAGGSVLLSWSAFTRNYCLESTPALPGNNWTRVTNSVLTTNGQHTMALSLAGSARFLRLRQE